MKKGLLIAAMIVVTGAAAASMMPVQAHASVIGIQLCDNGQNCNNPPLEKYADLNTWTTWAGDIDDYDPDYIRVLAGNTPIPADTDIRIGIQARDNVSCNIFFKCWEDGGKVVYTPWASQGGWSDWGSDKDSWDPDQYRLIVETRPLAEKSVTGFQLEVQLSNADIGDKPNNSFWGNNWDTAGCGFYSYAAGSDVTPVSSAGGGWTAGKNGGWAGMEYKGSFLPDPNCVRVKLTATVDFDKPVTTLKLYKNGVLTSTPGNAATVASTDSLVIAWSGTNNTTNCQQYGASNPADFLVSGPSASVSVAGPSAGTSATYTARCGNAHVWGDPSSLTITRTAGVPSAPSGLSASCNIAGNRVTLSWAATTGASGYYPRVSPFTGACPATLPSKTSTTCYTDNYAATSINVAITPGKLYSWGVHAGNTEGTSNPTTSSFICGVCSVTVNNVPTTLTNGQSTGNVYTVNSVPFGQSCPATSNYTCTSGTMVPSSGGVYYTTCAPAAPVQEDITLKANNSDSTSISVRSGSQVTLSYDGKNSSSCTLSGAGEFTSSPTLSRTLTTGNVSGSVTATVNQKSIFTFACSLGGSSKTKSVTVNMVPNVIEI